jgi:endonuclease YncB( thermonuclease family)
MPTKMRSFVAVALALLTWSSARAADYEGPAVVVDGDTIELHVGDKTIPVRLFGICCGRVLSKG